MCQQICPPTARAIDLARPEQTMELEAAAVVVATGYQPADPRCRPHYGYGRIPNIITGLELEEMLRRTARGLRRPDDGAPVRRVAFIQCVGSRDQDHPYCSQVCCAYTLRLARLLKHRLPGGRSHHLLHGPAECGAQFCRIPRRGPAGDQGTAGLARGPAAQPRTAPSVCAIWMRRPAGRRAPPLTWWCWRWASARGPTTAELAALLELDLSPEGFFQAADPEHRT